MTKQCREQITENSNKKPIIQIETNIYLGKKPRTNYYHTVTKQKCDHDRAVYGCGVVSYKQY